MIGQSDDVVAFPQLRKQPVGIGTPRTPLAREELNDRIRATANLDGPSRQCGKTKDKDQAEAERKGVHGRVLYALISPPASQLMVKVSTP